MKKMNPSLQGIIVLFVIAVVCVSLLAILNDLLYVPPDTSTFNSTVAGEYNAEIEVDKTVALSSGKINAVAEGVTTDNKNVVGLYITANSVGNAESSVIVVIINTADHKILGAKEVTDGGTGGYSYDESKLADLVGVEIPADNSFTLSMVLFTGATPNSQSSQVVLNAFITAAEYYNQVYRGGND